MKEYASYVNVVKMSYILWLHVLWINKKETYFITRSIKSYQKEFSQLDDVWKSIFLFTFDDAKTLSWLGKYLYKSFEVRASLYIHWSRWSPMVAGLALWRLSPYPEPVVFQWQSSGNPVCLELRPQCTLECHWRNSSVLPVVFQWLSSGLPVCSNYAN